MAEGPATGLGIAPVRTAFSKKRTDRNVSTELSKKGNCARRTSPPTASAIALFVVPKSMPTEPRTQATSTVGLSVNDFLDDAANRKELILAGGFAAVVRLAKPHRLHAVGRRIGGGKNDDRNRVTVQFLQYFASASLRHI